MQANLYNALADRKRFVVLYPDIDELGRLQPGPLRNCWRFPIATSWFRESGDTALLATMSRSTFAAWGRHDRVWSQVSGRFRSPRNHG